MHYLMRGLQDSGFRSSLARSLGDTTTGELQSAVICFTGASIASAWIPCSAVHAKVSFGCRAGIAGCAIASWWIGVAVVLLSLAVEDLVGALENSVMTTSAVYDPRDLGEGSQGYKRWRSALSIPYPYGSHRGEDDGLVP